LIISVPVPVPAKVWLYYHKPKSSPLNKIIKTKIQNMPKFSRQAPSQLIAKLLRWMLLLKRYSSCEIMSPFLFRPSAPLPRESRRSWVRSPWIRRQIAGKGSYVPTLSSKTRIVSLLLLLGMHRISVRADNAAFFDIRYPAGYQIGQPDIRPDIRLMYSWSRDLLIFSSNKAKKNFQKKII
jgi:hypothetical protein